MWRRGGAVGFVLTVAAVLVLLGVGPATAAPELRVSPDSGLPGSTVTVEGTGFPAGDVEIRWNSPTGALLTTATGPDFSVTATVPEDAPPDPSTIVAVAPEGNGVVTSNAFYQVTPTETTLPDTTGSVDTTVPTTVPVQTTVPVDTTVATTPVPSARDTGTSPARGGGVDGGTDPVMTETAETAGGTGPSAAGGSSPTAATGTAAGGAPPSSVTSVPVGTGSPGAGSPGAGAGPAGGGTATAPPPPLSSPNDGGASPAGADAAGQALGPAASSQSSGVVRSPGLLAAGLGLALTGLVILFVRNRHRLGS